MRKRAVLMIALVVLTACTSGVSANQKGNYWLSLPLNVVVPTGDLADISSTGWGIGFLVGYWITDSFLLDTGVTFQNFGEKKVTDDVKINGAIVPIELGISYYFMKESKYRPYIVFTTGYFNYESDFREEWALGQKNKPGNSLGLGMAFLRGMNNEAMLFVEPRVYAIYDDEVLNYWAINFGIAWNIGG